MKSNFQALEPAPLGADQRGAQRFALLLRAGKLVSQDGEFLCILRDASSGGLKARLFHELPRSTRFELELANGESFPIELVWQRDGHAGFRFVDRAIDLGELVEEASQLPKRNLRLRLTMPVLLEFDGSELAGVMQDISQNGAQIEVAQALAIGQQVTITAPGLPDLVARVRWRRHSAHGLIFQRGFRLDELAALIGRIQGEPRKPAEPGRRRA